MLLNRYFYWKKIRKILMLFDVEYWLWKSNFGAPNYTNSQNSIISFGQPYVDFLTEIFLLNFAPLPWKIDSPHCILGPLDFQTFLRLWPSQTQTEPILDRDRFLVWFLRLLRCIDSNCRPAVAAAQRCVLTIFCSVSFWMLVVIFFFLKGFIQRDMLC